MKGKGEGVEISLLGRREILGRYSSSPIRETAGVVCSRKILDGLTWPYVAGGYELTGYGLIYFRVPDFPGIRCIATLRTCVSCSFMILLFPFPRK